MKIDLETYCHTFIKLLETKGIYLDFVECGQSDFTYCMLQYHYLMISIQSDKNFKQFTKKIADKTEYYFFVELAVKLHEYEEPYLLISEKSIQFYSENNLIVEVDIQDYKNLLILL